MFAPTSGFSGFSVRDSAETAEFYRTVLGLTVTEQAYGGYIQLPGGDTQVFFYPKGDAHTPATFTILNFAVNDIDAAVAELKTRGVTFDTSKYTDDQGIQRGLTSGHGPDQAWFKDPSGNILSVLKT